MTNARDVGEYSFKITPGPDLEWNEAAGGGTGVKTIHWSITKRLLNKPKAVTNLVYNCTNQVGVTYVDADFTEYCTFDASSVTNATNAGDYNYSVSLDEPANTAWADDLSTNVVNGTWTIVRQKVALPTRNPEPLVFDNTEKRGFIAIDYERYELTAGVTNATEGGSHPFEFSLLGNGSAVNYVWDIDPVSSEPYSGEWTIEPAANEVTAPMLVGWRLGAAPNEPTATATWGEIKYAYVLGDGLGDVADWIYDASLINTDGVWTVIAMVDATNSWNGATNSAQFVMWDDPAKLFRDYVEIKISAPTGATGTLTNFPALVRISESRFQGFSYARAGSDSSNLSFLDGARNPLPYEAEVWNTLGESLVWVRVPLLPPEGATITMYWCLKDGRAPPENNPAEVWTNYVAVIHGGSSITNIAMASVVASAGSSVSLNANAGKVGGGLRKTKVTNNYIGVNVVNVASKLANTGRYTVSAWFKRNGLGGNNNGTHVLGASRAGWNSGEGYAWRQVSGNYIDVASRNTQQFSSSSYTLADGVWGYAAFSYEKNVSLTTYFNGAQDNKKTSGIGNLENTSGLWSFGSYATTTPNAGGSDSFIGDMDELRIFNGVASGDWIKAEYETVQNEDFASQSSPVTIDGLKRNYWVSLPAMNKTEWDVAETAGVITNAGELAFCDVSNYIYSVYDSAQTFESTTSLTNAGYYRVVFLPTETEGFEPISYIIDIHVIDSQPYTGIVGNSGDSGRILLMNNHTWSKTSVTNVDYQGWFDADNAGANDGTTSTYWHHENLNAPSATGFNLQNGTESILYAADGRRLWHIANCRHGNTFPAAAATALDALQNYMPWDASYSRTIKDHTLNRRTQLQTAAIRSTVGQVVMQNTADAVVYSSCFTNGIGTIYFDAVNGWCRSTEVYDNYKLVVEIATNTVEGLEPTDINSVTYTVETDSESGEVISVTTNLYGNLESCWHAVPVIPYKRDGTTNFEKGEKTEELMLDIQNGGTMNNFFRVAVPVDISGAVRFRIRRITADPSKLVDASSFILLDNIIASIPAMRGDLVSAGHYDEEKTGSQILGWELVTSEPYPSVGNNNLIASAKPEFTLNIGDGSAPDTSTFFAAATMHYRWRYLGQSYSEWKDVALNPNDGFKSVLPLELPGRSGDVEYWFEYRSQAPFYKYVDYSGASNAAMDYTEDRGVLTNALNSARLLASAGTNWFFRVREGKSDYSGLDVVYRHGTSGTPQRVHMAIAGDHVWRGFVQTKEDQAGDILWRIEALDEQTEPFAEYAATTNYWYNENALDTLPISGSLKDNGTDESWTTLTQDAVSGYIMFQVDESVRPRSVTVVHADYQNANGWSDALNRRGYNNQGKLEGPIFVGTSTTNEYKVGVSPSKQFFTEDFSDWGTMVATNDAWTFPVGLTDIRPENMGGRKAYVTFAAETNGLWDVGQGMWVAKKYMISSGADAGVALQMEGGGKGYVQFLDTTSAPRGLESVSFNARLGQFIEFDDFNYYDGEVKMSLTNYTFYTRAAFDTDSNRSFKGNGSLSIIADYLPNKGCYEARWEWIANESNNKGGQRLCLYRWNVSRSGKKETLLTAWTNVNSFAQAKATSFGGGTYMPFYITVSNDTKNACTWVAAGVNNNAQAPSGTWPSSGWYIVACRDNDSQNRLTRGTYGVLSSNCSGLFLVPQYSPNVIFKEELANFKNTTGTQAGYFTYNVTRSNPTGFALRTDGFGTDDVNWNIVPGRMTTRKEGGTGSTSVGILADPNTQYLSIYLGDAGRANWGSEPITNIEIKTFGDMPFNLPLYITKNCSIRFAVPGSGQDVRTDVVVDSLKMKQWRGGNWDDDDVYKLLPAWADDQHARSPTTSVRRPGYTNFVFTSAWVTNNMVLLSAKRANLDVPSSIRAPLMDGYKRTAEGEDGTTRAKGLGMISIEYANAQENAELELQISTNSTDWATIDRYDKMYSSLYWTSVTNFKFSAMTDAQRRHGVLNCYVGLHDVKGAMRVIVSTNAIANVARVTERSRFGDVYILAIAASDEPAVDVHSWWGWNMRTVGGDEDSEKRMLLTDFATSVGEAGLSVALNNSVSANFKESLINVNDRESYRPHKPFVQTPTFTTDFIGEVSFMARKYSPDDPTAAIVVYGSKDISYTDEGSWRQIPGAVFYVTNSLYETYSFKTPSETFRALRLAISGVDDLTEDPSKSGGNEIPEGISAPQRVLVDEVFVCEAVLPRMGFKNVGCFSVDMSKTTEVPGVPSAARQPLCGEAWGVQCEVYAAQLASDIDLSYDPRVRFHWFLGSIPWGYENWKDKTTAEGRHSEWLSRATDTDSNRFVYRSSLRTSPNAVVSMSTVAPTYAQYMLEVVYYTVSGALKTNLLTSADWQTPSWYNPLDLNADPKFGNGDSFAAYNILDNVPPGWAWINEINIFGHYERLKNTEADCQFIEIAHPPESDITGWTVRLLELNRNTDLIITNVLARFGTSGLKGTKAISAQDADVNMVFRVIANQEARKSGKIEAAGGEVEAVWNVDNPTTLFTSAGEIGSYDPFVYQLVRASGIVEHEIMLEGTNFMESLNVQPQTYIFDMRDFVVSKQGKSEIVLPGLDIGGDGNSLSVTQNFGRCGMDAPTNDWTCYVAMTPSHKNIGQVIDPNHPVPSGEEILVYLTVSGDHIMQSLDDSNYTNGMFSLVIPKNSPTGTNVFYQVDPWYVLGSVRTGSVSILDNATRKIDKQPYVYRLDRVAQGISNNVTVVASAALNPRITTDWGVPEDDPYRPAIIDWLEKGVDVYGNAWADVAAGEIRLAQFMGLNADIISDLTLTEMYWLDMDPTVGNLALIGGMVSSSTGPVVDEHVISREAGGNTVVLTNRRMTVYMMITNRTDDTTSAHYGRHWSPYVLRGLAAGSNSLGYGTTMSSWDSVTFKITGMIMNDKTSFDNIDNKVPLRHFVFNEGSFGANGQSRIEVVDPYSTLSFGYMSGWKNWWDKHGWCPVMYFWTLDTRLPQMGVEMLKENSWYDD